MDRKQVESWLEKESKLGNNLAEAYLALLANAADDMKDHWFNQLGVMLEGAQKIIEHAKQERAKELNERQI